MTAPNITHRPVDWRLVVRAKRLMRQGLDLHEAAAFLGVFARDLDAALWREIGAGGWV
jgi:hypothetical protein